MIQNQKYILSILEELRSTRIAAGLTQAQAAEKIGYSLSGYKKWEGLKRVPSRLTAEAALSKLKNAVK